MPTRRTPGVSTSELLGRMVIDYRKGEFDRKLDKMGHPELMSRPPSRGASSRGPGSPGNVNGSLPRGPGSHVGPL